MTINMNTKYVCICVVLICAFQFVVADDDDDDEVSCIDVSMDELKGCKDWDDAPVTYNVKIGVTDDHHGVFNGKVVVNEQIIEGVEISVMIFLKTPNGEELIYSVGYDLCRRIGDKKALWAPLVDALNITSCPIAKGEYVLEDIMLNLHSLKPLMHRDYIGQYSIAIPVELTVKKIGCVFLTCEIYEDTRPKSECPNPQKD